MIGYINLKIMNIQWLLRICSAVILCGLLACGTNEKSDTSSNKLLTDSLTIFTFSATVEELCEDFNNDIDVAIDKFDRSKIILSGIVESTQNEKGNDCPHIIMACRETSKHKIKICLENNLSETDTIQSGKSTSVTVKYSTHTPDTILFMQTD